MIDPDSPANNALAEARVPVTRIRPSRDWIPLNLREVREYRKLLYFLVWRDIKVR